MHADDVGAYERRFRAAGLPLFIEDYTAREDIFTRAAPLLAFVFLGEMLGAIDLDWPLLANVAAAAGGLALLLVAFGLLNRLRGRPFWSLPEDVGWPELGAFILLPALLPLIFGGQLESALWTLAGNTLLVLLVYLVVGYGLFSIVRWTGARLFTQLRTSLSLLTRAIPLLMVFALVLFINTEMWQVFSSLTNAFLALVAGLFVLVGGVFVLFRLPREVRDLERDAGGFGPALEPRQRVNVGLVFFVSQSLQILVVALAIGAFFVAFGALTVSADVRESWAVVDGSTLVAFSLFGERIEITEALLRVSGGIAAFSGLYYAIAVLTDETYRTEFLEELTREMRDTFKARADYLALRARP